MWDGRNAGRYRGDGDGPYTIDVAGQLVLPPVPTIYRENTTIGESRYDLEGMLVTD